MEDVRDLPLNDTIKRLKDACVDCYGNLPGIHEAIVTVSDIRVILDALQEAQSDLDEVHGDYASAANQLGSALDCIASLEAKLSEAPVEKAWDEGYNACLRDEGDKGDPEHPSENPYSQPKEGAQ